MKLFDLYHLIHKHWVGAVYAASAEDAVKKGVDKFNTCVSATERNLDRNPAYDGPMGVLADYGE